MYHESLARRVARRTLPNRFFFLVVNGENRVKRQEDDPQGDDQTAEQLCDGRPADEYFRLTTEGDCRDVVR